MRMLCIGPMVRGSPVAVATLAAAFVTGPAAAQDQTYTLAVSTQGAPVQVTLDCAVVQNGVERHEQRQGVAPMELSFVASSVSCMVSAAGAVVIEAQSADGSSVSRVQTSGGQVRFNLSSG